MFPGLLFGVSPNTTEDRRSGKAAFITPFGAFCYTTMPFGLKSAGATYQRGIQKCLDPQLGRNVEAYVDDVVIKTRRAETFLSDLAGTFDNMKLNPDKCRSVFGTRTQRVFEQVRASRRIITLRPVCCD